MRPSNRVRSPAVYCYSSQALERVTAPLLTLTGLFDLRMSVGRYVWECVPMHMAGYAWTYGVRYTLPMVPFLRRSSSVTGTLMLTLDWGNLSLRQRFSAEHYLQTHSPLVCPYVRIRLNAPLRCAPPLFHHFLTRQLHWFRSLIWESFFLTTYL